MVFTENNKEKKDYFTTVMIVQSVICVILVASMLFSVRADGKFAQIMKTGYLKFMTSDFTAEDFADAFKMMKEYTAVFAEKPDEIADSDGTETETEEESESESLTIEEEPESTEEATESKTESSSNNKPKPNNTVKPTQPQEPETEEKTTEEPTTEEPTTEEPTTEEITTEEPTTSDDFFG